MKSKLKIAVALAFAAYAVILFALPILWRHLGERHWLLIGLCYAPPILYLFPLLPFMGAALLLRMRRLAVGVSLAVLLIALGPMSFQFPNRRKAEGVGRLSVLSYNVRAGLGGGQEIAAYLKSTDADLIGLQECRQPIDKNFHDPTPAITKALVGYHSARGGQRGELLTLSRYRIVSSKEHDLDGYCPCLETIVDVAGRQLRFLNVHVLTGDPKGVLKLGRHERTEFLVVTAKSRSDQSAALLRVLGQSELPTILVGDFNSPPSSDLYRRLASKMQDSFAEKGLGFGMTYSASRPLWRIDYLWASSALQVESCAVQRGELSDHKPLGGRLAW